MKSDLFFPITLIQILNLHIFKQKKWTHGNAYKNALSQRRQVEDVSDRPLCVILCFAFKLYFSKLLS